MAPPKDEADDVLDFLNSLPDSKSGTPKPQSSEGDKQENKEDFLEFLDELAAHEKKPVSKGKSSFEPKKKDAEETASTLVPAPVTAAVAADSALAGADTDADADADADAEAAPPGEDEIDPIGQISSWWNNEGSNKVSSLWGSITSNAQQISDQTYQLASTTSNQISQQRQKLLQENAFSTDQIAQLDNLGDRLNLVLTTMSHQITQGLIGPDDELLNILLIHDLYNINYLDKECSTKFNKVMNQVEGGIRTTVNNFNHKQGIESADQQVNLNLFYGKVIDGEKLCFANLESCIKDYSSYNLESDQKPEEKEEETANVTVASVNKSNIFISIQAITSRTSNETPSNESDGPILIDSSNHDSFSFTLILKDITNSVTIVTKTQPFPLIWAQWLNDEVKPEDENINPGEWVKDWIKDGLSLSFGVLAQQYVVKRMGY